MPESNRYVRIASRTPAENKTLVAALNTIFEPENNTGSAQQSKPVND